MKAVRATLLLLVLAALCLSSCSRSSSKIEPAKQTVTSAPSSDDNASDQASGPGIGVDLPLRGIVAGQPFKMSVWLDTADEDTAQDIADRAASSYTKEFLFSQSNNERQLLQMVEKALARIREGSFGECIHCGQEINAKRLEAVPCARHCIECQEKLEQGLLEEAQR